MVEVLDLVGSPVTDRRLLERLGSLDDKIKKVDPTKGFRIDEGPTSKRIAWQYEHITPVFTVLSRDDLERLGVQVPTRNVSDGSAYLVTADFDGSSKKSPDHPDAICRFTANIHIRTHSHAGTHADGYSHIMVAEKIPYNFAPAQFYSGPAVVIDVSEHLPHANGKIARYALIDEADRIGVRLEEESRVLACVYNETPTKWDPQFPVLDKGVAKFVAEHFVFFGTGSPSLDSPDYCPVLAGNHGVLFDGRVATAEGYNFDSLPINPQTGNRTWKGVIINQVVADRTFFNPTTNMPDAAGLISTFYITE